MALTCSESTEYLGVIFDHKLTWKLYIDDIKQQAEKRMILLKRLAGVSWGCATTTLLDTYKTFIKPVMTYGNAPLITVSERGINRLERLQNNALLLVTGVVKTTPIDALLLYTNDFLLQYEIKKSALKLYQKLIHLPHSDMLTKSEPRGLKTQDGYLQTVLKVMDEFDIPSRIEPLLPPLNPMEASEILYHLDLMSPVLKPQDCTAALFRVGMETIHNHFPLEAWLHIYTDGSKLEIDGVAGAGIYSEYFSHCLSLGTAKTAFDGEVEAIKVALTLSNARPSIFDRTVIFSDSQATILAIANCSQVLSS
nr:uncharacterized protein LOC107451003 [Parasteatoda tepidariorum]